MRMVFTHWEFEKDRLLLRVNVKGEGKKDDEKYLAQGAVLLTQTAKRFNGIVVQPWNFPEDVKSEITITFTIMFKDPKDFDAFNEKMSKQ